MKKITIILLIAVCLMSFVGIPLAKERPVNYGKVWLEASELSKAYCIAGFVAGMDLWSIKVLPILTSKIEKGLLTNEENEVILELTELRSYFAGLSENTDGAKNFYNIITNIYENPANTYILACKIILFAYKKLKGEDIEPLLREARKKALR